MIMGEGERGSHDVGIILGEGLLNDDDKKSGKK